MLTAPLPGWHGGQGQLWKARRSEPEPGTWPGTDKPWPAGLTFPLPGKLLSYLRRLPTQAKPPSPSLGAFLILRVRDTYPLRLVVAARAPSETGGWQCPARPCPPQAQPRASPLAESTDGRTGESTSISSSHDCQSPPHLQDFVESSLTFYCLICSSSLGLRRPSQPSSLYTSNCLYSLLPLPCTPPDLSPALRRRRS